MTEKEKQEVTTLRYLGLGYRAVAKALCISVNTIKTYCRANNLQTKDIPDNAGHCPICGKPVKQTPHKKKKVFCSNKCCLEYWRLKQTRKICACCGNSFVPIRKASKYCSHDCYVKARFYGGANAD